MALSGHVAASAHQGLWQHHVGIWISAALFSAIHMQFFGFIPRMLLGAAFGYLVVHSGSIWPAVTGHLVNNAGVVIAAAWMGPEWLEQGLEPQPLSTWDAYDWGQAAVALLALGWAGKRLFALGRPEAYLQALDTES
jgi:membrane protease YdiL (CAAX protease family)